ncbi:hypothetical protein H310_01689 [Aphanomyces invadans]|uniref:Uncharacterized protein n=1 Tax=Aphanomyces invadans TaxID=157072 RepID=A0A024UTP5_9STRA|nr:hypothetical protein H310_01689 [Aphanomyces invadans]ETW09297.1 hypothetical protein H310_01689 [Aphanomyces invadans]|eukprot:XP_008863102.1 hypothetical protein H310_01689 [Aphanomyces invadans]
MDGVQGVLIDDGTPTYQDLPGCLREPGKASTIVRHVFYILEMLSRQRGANRCVLGRSEGHCQWFPSHARGCHNRGDELSRYGIRRCHVEVRRRHAQTVGLELSLDDDGTSIIRTANTRTVSRRD